jgi:hypothetical protein
LARLARLDLRHLFAGYGASRPLRIVASKESTTMTLDQLMGRYFRLKQELEIAYAEKLWHSQRIDRLANDLAITEREIALRQLAA